VKPYAILIINLGTEGSDKCYDPAALSPIFQRNGSHNYLVHKTKIPLRFVIFM